MSGFQVVAGDIRSAAEQVEAAGEDVRRCDPSASVRDVGGALPGSQSAAAASSLHAAWRQRFRGWSEDATGQAQRLHESAPSYDESDYRADNEMRLLMHRTGEDR